MLRTATWAHSAAFATVTTQVQRPCKGADDWSKTSSAQDKLFTTCRDALQALVSPTDAQLALCSSGAYGEKEGEGPDKGTLPAQIELEKLSKRWNVPTGLHTATASNHKTYQSQLTARSSGSALTHDSAQVLSHLISRVACA